MRKFILDSDWWTDCDDAVALRLLCNAHRKKEVEVLGINVNGCMPYSIPSLDVFTRNCGVEIPLGLSHGAVDFPGAPSYQEHLAKSGKVLRSNDDVPESLDFYRQLLNDAPEASVEILSIGFTQELARLLREPEDAALVRRKVTHLWIMAGKWDEQGGKEYNFCLDPLTRRSGNELCARWPSPITFLGWEVGFDVITGAGLPENDLLRQVMSDHGSINGRSSWDPMLVLLAITGDPERAGYRCVRGRASVDANDGSNTFTESAAGPHRYVIKARSNDFYVSAINARLPLRQENGDPL